MLPARSGDRAPCRRRSRRWRFTQRVCDASRIAQAPDDALCLLGGIDLPEPRLCPGGQRTELIDYRLLIGAVETVVHCFSFILCYSRRLWIGFFRNERLPSLLYAHVEALAYHHGSPVRLVYDYVSRNIIVLLWPNAICAGTVCSSSLWTADHEYWKHNDLQRVQPGK